MIEMIVYDSLALCYIYSDEMYLRGRQSALKFVECHFSLCPLLKGCTWESYLKSHTSIFLSVNWGV